MAKKHMKNGKFRAITLPISGVCLAVAIALPILGDMFSTSIDTTMGLGALHVQEVKGSENWDTKYIDKKYQSKEESRNAANKISKQITDEGCVLLKNEGTLPLAKGSELVVFGDGFRAPAYGGKGSGGIDTSKEYVYTPEKALKKHFTLNNAIATITKTNAKIVDVQEAAGTSAAIQGAGGMFENDFGLKGVPVAEYDGVKTQISGKTAIIFIARGGGESFDIKRDGYADGTRHNLTLSANEKATIRYLKDNGASKIVAILDASNVFEAGELQSGEYAADAILSVGGPGAAGFESMADILAGDVNPSGRTVDIYAKDLLKTPALTNFGAFEYTNAEFEWQGSQHKGTFVHYEEGIYVGYKYYETAAAMGKITYENEVVYPFGYGLSYTSFSQEFLSFEVVGSLAKATVKVTNTGTKAGKEVVQMYYAAPYTAGDKAEKVEKATKNLVEFAKTKVLAPGADETITLEWNIEDMASYNYMRSNGDGTKGCYQLASGDYTIYLGKDSHSEWAHKSWSNPSTINYDNSNPRQSEKDGQSILDKEGHPTGVPEKSAIDSRASFVAATNQFQELSDFMNESGMTLLTRDAMDALPTAPTGSDFTLAAKYLANWNKTARGKYDYATNPETGNVVGSLVYSEKMPEHKDNGLTLSVLRGKGYYDRLWDDLLDQIDFSDSKVQEQLRDLLYYGAYNSGNLDCVGKPKVNDFDGPQGISSFMAQGLDACAYCSEVTVASTWNVELAHKYGEAIGQEGLTNDVVGWYGPAMNTHRTPFSGRNFEYYSEDGLLAGKMAAAAVSGAADQGFYAFMKHFALNDQETNRMDGLCTWATEQAVREIYLKPFEIVAKEARGKVYFTSDDQGTKDYKVMRGSTAVMSSFNNIGTTMASGHAGLLTKVLRDEWGFQGEVITDFGPYVDHDLMIRAGNDYLLNANWGGAKETFQAVFKDTTSATARQTIRRSVKNMCYTAVNSAAFNGVAPGAKTYRDIAPWRILLTSVTALFGVAGIGLVAWNVYRTLDAKKHPENYAD
ncbi:MAG: glycoside hydrolase family 3 C-terminal domain-containing protein [Bacilli bacterium]|nr:glycoside hydrolase family 3 C-terminal domain-containing protein [Bacilli bacterium]